MCHVVAGDAHNMLAAMTRNSLQRYKQVDTSTHPVSQTSPHLCPWTPLRHDTSLHTAEVLGGVRIITPLGLHCSLLGREVHSTGTFYPFLVLPFSPSLRFCPVLSWFAQAPTLVPLVSAWITSGSRHSTARISWFQVPANAAFASLCLLCVLTSPLPPAAAFSTAKRSMPHIIPTKFASKTLFVIDMVWNGGTTIETEALAWSDTPDPANEFACELWGQQWGFEHGLDPAPTMRTTPGEVPVRCIASACTHCAEAHSPLAESPQCAQAHAPARSMLRRTQSLKVLKD